MRILAAGLSDRLRVRPPAVEAALFGGLALLLLSIAPPLNYGSDGASMLAVAESIVTDADLSVACDAAAIRGTGGACYSIFYLLQSILLVPFVAIGRLGGELVGLPPSISAGPLACCTWAGRRMVRIPPSCVARRRASAARRSAHRCRPARPQRRRRATR